LSYQSYFNSVHYDFLRKQHFRDETTLLKIFSIIQADYIIRVKFLPIGEIKFYIVSKKFLNLGCQTNLYLNFFITCETLLTIGETEPEFVKF
jgi:hypothetical protein